MRLEKTSVIKRRVMKKEKNSQAKFINKEKKAKNIKAVCIMASRITILSNLVRPQMFQIFLRKISNPQSLIIMFSENSHLGIKAGPQNQVQKNIFFSIRDYL
jgi:hypothetical protein